MGVLLLLLLTILSPVARVVAFIVFLVSAVVLIARAVQRRPLRGWVVAVVGSLVLIPVFDGISGAMYGSGSTGGSGGMAEGSDPGDAPSWLESMPEAEREYVTRSGEITNESSDVVNSSIVLIDQCGGSCMLVETSREEVAGNVQRMEELAEEASRLAPPDGYDESYEAFVRGLRKRYELVNYLSIGVQMGRDPYLDSLLLDANNYTGRMVELAPPDGQRLYRQESPYNSQYEGA